MAAIFDFYHEVKVQKEMEIKRDTIMTSYFEEMTLGDSLSLQLIEHDVHFVKKHRSFDDYLLSIIQSY